MWNRFHAARLRGLARQFSAVLILGSRQVGKTTLARAAFPAAPYLDLEQPNVRQLFADDPHFQIESRLTARVRALVLDEVQCVPAVFAALRGLIDRGSKRVAVEIKAGRGDKVPAARVPEQAMRDVGAKTGWVLDQAEGTDTLRPGLARRSFTATPEWLP